MITREDLDRAFVQQRELTSAAIEDGLGLDSYMDNLGLDAGALMGWARDYATGNIMDARPEWEQGDIVFVASLLSRALAVGLILGRDTKP